MANKYLIHGATYCGDGTASTEAASAGAAGAWNDINVFEGTAPAYGSLAAGDTVFMRSKTSAGADITRTLAATVTLGSAAATSSAWVTWVLDNGVVWPGIDGTLTYNCPSTYVVHARSYNQYVAMTQDALRIVETNAAANSKGYWSGDNAKTSKILFDFSFATTSAGSQMTSSGTAGCTHEDIHIRSFKRSAPLFRVNSYNRTKLINPDIELLDSSDTDPVFFIYDNSLFEIYGGQVRGAGAVSGVLLLRYRNYTDSSFIDFKFPRQMTFSAPDGNNFDASPVYKASAIGSDDGLGSALKESWGLADSRDDNNYPKLNAVLPDSANTPWAWKLCPMTTTEQHPLKLPMSQYFTDSAGAREITVNLLIANTLTNVSKQSVWMTVDYIDNATGLKKSINTRDYLAGALDASTANWTATTYGAASLLKRKLSVVTPTAIKPNTPITVVLWSTVKAASQTDELGDIMFLCPEFSVNVP